MEAALLAGVEITDDDLRRLAQQRALAARDRLLASAQIEPARLFLVERTASADAGAGRRESRVDFVLK